MGRQLPVNVPIKGRDGVSPVFKQIAGGSRRLQDRLAQVNKASGALGRGLGTLSRPLSGVLGLASTAGFAGLITGMADTADQAVKTADRIGMPVEALQELRFAAQQNGMQTEVLDKSLEVLNQRIGRATNGDKRLQELFAAIGIGAETLANAGPEEILNRISDAAAQIEDPMQRAFVVSELFGEEGRKMGNLLAQGAAGISALRAEARRTGDIVSEADARNAERFNDELNKTQKALMGAIQPLVMELLPALTDTAVAVSEFAQANPELIQYLGMAAAGVGGLSVGMNVARMAFGGMLGPMARMIFSTKDFHLAAQFGVKGLGLMKIAMLGSPFARFGAAAGGAAAGGLKLFSAGLGGVRKGLNLLKLAMLSNPFTALVVAATTAIAIIYDNWDNIVGWFTSRLNAVRDGFKTGFIDGIMALIKNFHPLRLFAGAIDGLADYIFGIDLSGMIKKKLQSLTSIMPDWMAKGLGFDTEAQQPTAPAGAPGSAAQPKKVEEEKGFFGGLMDGAADLVGFGGGDTPSSTVPAEVQAVPSPTPGVGAGVPSPRAARAGDVPGAAAVGVTGQIRVVVEVGPNNQIQVTGGGVDGPASSMITLSDAAGRNLAGSGQ